MLDSVTTKFTERQANAVGPLSLALLGDAVYELLVRTNLIAKGPALVDSLHQSTGKSRGPHSADPFRR